MVRLSRLGRTCFLSASEETLACRLGPVFSTIFGTYISPYDLLVSSATGYWSHETQDVQRFTGHHKAHWPVFDFGSWDLTVSYAAALSSLALVDNRNDRRRYSDFEVVRVKSVGADDTWWPVPKV